MSMTTVFVDVTNPRRPREIARDARDPTGPAQESIERLADAYSRPGKTVRVFCDGRYVKPWRKQGDLDAAYETHDGWATPDYRTVVS
jgi:hypothetical protein